MQFNKELTNCENAKQFIYDLKKNQLDIHFDDDIEDIFKGRLSELQIKQLQDRIQELFKLLNDPFKYLIDHEKYH